MSCDQNSQVVSLNLDTVTKEDEGWYWCGVKEGPRYGETAAVYVAVESRVKGESVRARPTCPRGLQRKLPENISIKRGPRFGCKRQGPGPGEVSFLVSFILPKRASQINIQIHQK